MVSFYSVLHCFALPPLRSVVWGIFVFALSLGGVYGQSMNPVRYDIGNPTVRDVWVDPVNGNDDNPGTANRPLQTVTAAWDMIPDGVELTGNGWRINLKPGTYTDEHIPIYWEDKHGSFRFPIIIRPAEGKSTVRIEAGFNIALCSYVYLTDLILYDTVFATADIIHFQFSQHLLLRNCSLTAHRDMTQECLKVNQCQYVYIEDCDISGAWDNAVDFVAVQYGHVVGSKIHNCGDWALYLKGGSAYFRVEANEFYNAGTGGFTAGQGTGFQFMTPPFLHYEAYDMKFVNNIVHDVEGAGFGVNGGYNILIAHNTCYRVGERSHVIEATFGGRSCDGAPGGDFDSCDVYRLRGGWGNALVSDGNNYVRIPNKNVYIYNNIVYNPAGYESLWQHLSVPAAYSGEWNVNVNAPNPAYADDNLRIRGNIVWNGPTDHPLGIGDESGCPPNNPNCNANQLKADNAFNSIEPQFTNAAEGNFIPMKNGTVYQATTYEIPNFPGGDRPNKPTTQVGVLDNVLPRDAKGTVRTGKPIAGAIIGEGGSTSAADEMINGTVFSIRYINGTPFLYCSVNQAKSIAITMVDLRGKKMNYRFPDEIPSGETWIPLDEMLSGVYIMSIKTDNSVVLQTVVL